MSELLTNVRKIASQRDACWSALVTIIALLEHRDFDYIERAETIAKEALERARAGI